MPAPYAFTRFREIRAVVAGAKKKRGGGAKKKGENFCCLFSKEGEPSLDCRDKFLSIAVYLERLIVYIEMYVCMFVCF